MKSRYFNLTVKVTNVQLLDVLVSSVVSMTLYKILFYLNYRRLDGNIY